MNVAFHFGHACHRLVNSISYVPPCLKLKFLRFAYTVYVCFTYGSYLSLSLSSYTLFALLLLQKHTVLCEVRAESLYKVLVSISLQCVN